MKIAMVFPTRESEKAISGYSSTLTESIRKQAIMIEDFHYDAGKPFTLFKNLSKLSDYDIIHIQHEYNLLGKYGLPFFVVFLYLGIFKKNKLVTTMHTALSMNEKFNENKIRTIFRKSLYFFQNIFINLASDEVVVHANFFKDILMKDYNFNKDKIKTLPQGIIENIKTLSKQKAKEKFNLNGNIYIFMGSMIPAHGQDIIIKQANKIGKTILVVANPTNVNDRNAQRVKDYLHQNVDYVKKHNLTKFVRFDISEISDKKKEWWEYFSASDLVLLPYRGGVGSGIFAHAMAMKKPVIASNIKFFKEISDNYGCIKIVKSEKEYPRIIKEAMKPNNYNKMTKECERYLKNNSLSAIAEKYKLFYLSLLN